MVTEGEETQDRKKENRDRISITSTVTLDGELYFMIKKGSMDSDHIIRLPWSASFRNTWIPLHVLG